MLIRDLNDMNVLLVKNLHRIKQIDFDVIVHLPRSGTIPASILATHMRAPFASVDEFCAGIVNTRKAEYKTLHKILLVDDSIRTGNQLKDAVERIKAARPDALIHSLCVYSTVISDRIYDATMVLSEHHDVDYIYPWFLWKTKRIKKVAFDMDGVLCRDCTKDEDDEGEKYLNFLNTAPQKFKTDFVLGAIVTGRLERYRPQTEEWLARHGVQYRELIMGPWSSNAERKQANPAVWKADLYRRSHFKLFVESSEREALVIAARSQKKVWCIDTQRAYG